MLIYCSPLKRLASRLEWISGTQYNQPVKDTSILKWEWWFGRKCGRRKSVDCCSVFFHNSRQKGVSVVAGRKWTEECEFEVYALIVTNWSGKEAWCYDCDCPSPFRLKLDCAHGVNVFHERWVWSLSGLHYFCRFLCFGRVTDTLPFGFLAVNSDRRHSLYTAGG